MEKNNNFKEGIVKYNNYSYKYTIKDLGNIAGNETIQVICKGAGMNEIFSKDDLGLVIDEIIPSYIEIKIENNKNEYLQLRLSKSQKNKLKKQAEKSKMNLSEFVLSKCLD